MIIPAADQNIYQNSFQALYDSLNQAYWYASTVEAKDAINSLAQAVLEVLTAMNQEQLDSNTARYAELKVRITDVNTQLRQAQAQINNWIHAISIATGLAKTIDQALASAAKLMAV